MSEKALLFSTNFVKMNTGWKQEARFLFGGDAAYGKN